MGVFTRIIITALLIGFASGTTAQATKRRQQQAKRAEARATRKKMDDEAYRRYVSKRIAAAFASEKEPLWTPENRKKALVSGALLVIVGSALCQIISSVSIVTYSG